MTIDIKNEFGSLKLTPFEQRNKNIGWVSPKIGLEAALILYKENKQNFLEIENPLPEVNLESIPKKDKEFKNAVSNNLIRLVNSKTLEVFEVDVKIAPGVNSEHEIVKLINWEK